MNFLAHCALAEFAGPSGNDTLRTGLLAGAVLGDFVKGTVPEHWPEPLIAGVRLHRRIDAASNRNVHIRATNQLFPQALRRYAPIFTDLLADHWLSLKWSAHHAEPLPAFSVACYAAIDEHRQHLPAAGEKFYAYMKQEDLLASYGAWHHVERGMRSVLRRLGRLDLEDAAREGMQAVLAESGAHFDVYYPELAAEAAEFVAGISAAR